MDGVAPKGQEQNLHKKDAKMEKQREGQQSKEVKSLEFLIITRWRG